MDASKTDLNNILKHRPGHATNKKGLLACLVISIALHLLLLYWLTTFKNAFLQDLSKHPQPPQSNIQLELASRPQTIPETKPVPPAEPEPLVQETPPPEKIAQQAEPEQLPKSDTQEPAVSSPDKPEDANHTITAALQGRRPDFSQLRSEQTQQGSKAGDDMWAINPRVMEKIARARADKLARQQHKKAIERLSLRSFFESGRATSRTDGNGVHYERISSAKPAHWLFVVLMGAGGEICAKVQQLPGGGEVATPVSCNELRQLAQDENVKPYIHPALRTREESLTIISNHTKTLDQKFIDRLAKLLPSKSDPQQSDSLNLEWAPPILKAKP